ncbi:hypothetical protein COCSUDRAFT_55184 [Coccomyxa subellipsoidea C-169]|uniref:Uncharacterized protein n=1 Tax=Coccomyxa subellipsoidea (strain C-169) TaxID=574566 RepID=I0Z942_COCSC|nr:hypothetical protein COCSUDRAFT_55184 [Coccomyxa subellipsoidea C-169]EIE27161.1 hypothetical protein COCSUDRAFT_55184 [Coccomyxa subellipsoidea C-169]|eukprot:XP_005651705.1 hypothetical protein COCSUDRAFT_55184 [Coccomyxa subellipsoidea C-169]
MDDGSSHNVIRVAKPDCSFSNATQVAGLTDTPFNLTFREPGTFYYACSDDGIADAVAAKAAPAESGVQRKQPATAGDSHCEPPVLVAGTNDTFHVTCLSPGVANDYYNLANPYPSRIVAIINETSQIVDSTGRPVPLSEAYAHHFFGNARFVVAEGSELRGTLDKLPLPHPYYQLVNGTFFKDPSTRRMNIHLINTLGVDPDHIAPCIECWCPDSAAAFQGLGSTKSYLGGTACCSPLNCPTPRANESATVYHLQYNVSYRHAHSRRASCTFSQYPEQIDELVQASPVLLDVVNGSVEYDVLKQGPGMIDVKNFTGPFDQQCPQSAPYGLLRCTGHQHIDTAGQEKGYLVRMTDDTLVPPYPLKPGQNVTIVSKYSADDRHYGVMALWILTVTNWDPTCPGSGGTPAASTPPGSFNIFTTFTGPSGGAVANTTVF